MMDTTTREGAFGDVFLNDFQLYGDDSFVKNPTLVNLHFAQARHDHMSGSTSTLRGGGTPSHFNVHNAMQAIRQSSLHITVPADPYHVATARPIEALSYVRAAPFAMIDYLNLRASKHPVVKWTGRQMYILYLFSTYSSDKKYNKYFGLPPDMTERFGIHDLTNVTDGKVTVEPISTTVLQNQLQEMATVPQTFVLPLFMLPWGRNNQRNFNVFRADKTELSIEVFWKDVAYFINNADKRVNADDEAATFNKTVSLSDMTCEMYSFGYSLPEIVRSAVRMYKQLSIPMLEMYTTTIETPIKSADGSLTQQTDLEITDFKGLSKCILSYYVPPDDDDSGRIGTNDPMRIGKGLPGAPSDDGIIHYPQLKFNNHTWHDTTNVPDQYYNELVYSHCHWKTPDYQITVVPISDNIMAPFATQTLEVQHYDRPRFACQVKFQEEGGKIFVHSLADYAFVYKKRNAGREFY
jgi:hypothetical protein